MMILKQTNWFCVGFCRFTVVLATCLVLAACVTPPLAVKDVEIDRPTEGGKLALSINQYKNTGNKYALCADCLPPTVKTLPAPPSLVESVLITPNRAPVVSVPNPAKTLETVGENSQQNTLKLKVAPELKAHVYFLYNSAALGPYSKQVLDGLAKRVQSSDEVLVIGSADADGTAVGNISLARQRATSVRNYLVLQGVSQNQIQTQSNHAAFVADNATAAGRAKNRRAEIVVTTATQN